MALKVDDPFLTIAVTGHRPERLGGYGDNIYRALMNLAADELTVLKPALVLTGMAIGWDQAVAHTCTQMGIPWKAIVPFPGQEMEWPRKARAKYYALLKEAAEVYYVSQCATYLPQKFLSRNRYLVDHSDMILALWDGKPGGTAHCVAYAQDRFSDVINCWPRWKPPQEEIKEECPESVISVSTSKLLKVDMPLSKSRD